MKINENKDLTLGKIKEYLIKCDATTEVYFSILNLVPDIENYGSWRGAYDSPAIGWKSDGIAPTVEDLINVIDDLLYECFYGWKGGRFHYNEDSILYIDRSGVSTCTTIKGIGQNWKGVIIDLGPSLIYEG